MTKEEFKRIYDQRFHVRTRTLMSTAQATIGAWEKKNFGEGTPDYQRVLGVLEEIGELADEEKNVSLNELVARASKLVRAQLKGEQGIRGTKEEHDAAKKDAVGDIAIYLMNYCNSQGWEFDEIIYTTMFRVLERDWTKNKRDGTS